MFQITLRTARELSGYTVEEAARHLEIPINTYIAYENDPGVIPKVIACKIKKMYNVLLELIEIR